MSDQNSGVRLFVTDTDDTILGKDTATERFRRTWEALPVESRPLLVYSTGRSVRDTQWLVQSHRLPVPEFIIGGNGTELHDPVDAHASAEFSAGLEPGWDRAAVEQIVGTIPGVRRQPTEFLNPHKSSWLWHHATRGEVFQLGVRLQRAGLETDVSYTGGVFLDVLPRRAGKGNALAWLCRRIDVPLTRVLVVGAGANNAAMFALPGVRGILIGNASSELFAATGRFSPRMECATHADGVLRGLLRYGVINEADVPAAS